MSPHQKNGGGNEGGAEPLLEMIWVEERQLCDELSRHGMGWHAPARQLLNFTTALCPVACANCTTVQLHKVDLRTFKGGGQE